MSASIRLFSSVALLAALSGCVSGDKPLKLESSMNGQLATQLDGRLATSFKLDGPVQIQMQLQGPTINYVGTYISDELYDQITLAQATDDWLIAVLGEPTARTPLRDGSEVWRWTYAPTTQQGAVIEIFDKSDKPPKLASRAVFVQLRDLKAIRKWKG